MQIVREEDLLGMSTGTIFGTYDQDNHIFGPLLAIKRSVEDAEAENVAGEGNPTPKIVARYLVPFMGLSEEHQKELIEQALEGDSEIYPSGEIEYYNEELLVTIKPKDPERLFYVLGEPELNSIDWALKLN